MYGLMLNRRYLACIVKSVVLSLRSGILSDFEGFLASRLLPLLTERLHLS